MKNLYPKGKGKIHPSPAPPSSAAGGGTGGMSSSLGYDALAVLKLLPAAILALTAALGSEDQEVLAYLLTRSLQGAGGGGAGWGGGVSGGDARPRCRRAAGAAHLPVFDCGCFDCYTSFWSRWDCSPDRELIHQVIEAFEEHLASSEKMASGKGRRRERKEKGGKRGKDKDRKKKSAVPPAEEASEVADENANVNEEPPATALAVCGVENLPDEVKLAVDVTEVGGEEERREEEELPEGEEEEEEAVDEPSSETAIGSGQRRSGWPDVTGIFNLRLWGLWSPAV